MKLSQILLDVHPIGVPEILIILVFLAIIIYLFILIKKKFSGNR
jgi:hypothetical protein